MHKGYRVQAAVRIATDVQVTLTQYSWWNIQRYTERTQSSVDYIPRVMKCLFDLQVFEKDFFTNTTDQNLQYSLRWFLKAEKFFLFQYNQELVLPCDFFGNPTPEISWFKDNSSTPVKAKWSSIDNNGSLIIQGLCKYIKKSGVRLPNDRRLYTASCGIRAITKEDESHFILLNQGVRHMFFVPQSYAGARELNTAANQKRPFNSPVMKTHF